jgi:hypothetical protein
VTDKPLSSSSHGPAEVDEGPHQPDPTPLWNESWYFDFADPAGGLGGWLRLGLYPNEDRAWINVLLCGPDRPTVALNDFEVATPADPFDIRTPDIVLTQEVTSPLRQYRVTARGSGSAFDDPAALLRGESGRPVEVSLDLTWQTTGVPYAYRVATRYEIPCTVSGAVVVDGVEHRLDGVAGQRDHSWGVRDWWAMDWVWSALHLEDGTHLHGVDLRIPDLPPIGIGYAQQDGTALVELSTVATEATFAENDLPVETMLTLQPGDLVATAKVVAHAPVRLVADDGRVAQFPRAWVQVTMADGRRGVGWLEWNRNR